MSMEQFEITKIRGNSSETVKDLVAGEVPLTIIVNNEELVTLLCTPGDLKDLVRGFLFTSGLVAKPEEIRNMVMDETRWTASVELTAVLDKDWLFKRLYTSGCGKGTLFYNVLDLAHKEKITSSFKINSGQISKLVKDFQKKSDIFLKTGGVHSAAITDGADILVFREDIGRHNAIDKVIGAWLEQKITYENKMLLTSGRVSSEVIFKIQKCRIPAIASISAPTNQAVRLARDMGLTLVGFARGERMNIYSCPERINIL